MNHPFFYGLIVLIVGIVIGCAGVHVMALLGISKKRIPEIKPRSAMARVLDGGRDEQSSL